MNMKEGWIYKKLGSVTKVVSGSTPKTNIKEYWGGSNKWVTPAELNDRMFILDTKRTITDKAVLHTNLNLLPVGTVLLSSRAPIGKVAIVGAPMYCNQGFKNLICSDLLYNLFLYWFLKGKKNYLNSLGRGATFKEISKNIVESILIPLPELSEQKKIVAELEKLNEILTKKHEQLKELDRLGQAIFYDMFGDLQSNIYNYNIESLNDIFEVITDGTHQTPTYTIDKDNGYKFLSAKDVVSGSIDWTNVKYIPHELHEVLYKRLAPRRNDILLCKNGTTGTCALVDTDEVFDIYVSLALLRPYAKYNPIYLVHAINSPCTKMQFNDALKGVGVPNLHLGEIRRVKIIVPPIDFQNHFERKVIGIESQKQKIKQSIVEVQQLLDYTMNKYFG